MTGCGNEMDETGTQIGKQVTMTMQAATDAPQTRADYTDDGTNNKMLFSWRSGDALSVVVDGVAGNENCQLSTTAAGKSVPFSGTVTTFTGTQTIYAFYPYNSTAYTVSGSGATATAALTLPNPQAYIVDGAISNSFMVGVGTATATGADISASASLKQVMSIIKLNITNAPAAVTGVKLKCAEAVFPTTATVKLSDATISAPGTLVKELSMTVTDRTAPATKAVSFAIFPTDLSGKKIQVEVSFTGGETKTIEKDGTSFVRNMHYVMEFNATGAAKADFIEVNGIKVAVGNLVADGPNDCKIGTPTDGGLYFQFGSLIGWSNTGNPAAIAVRPTNFNGNEDWSHTGKIWQGATGTVPFTTPSSATARERAGIGDPCRYYLGGTWRLPKKEEFDKLFDGHNNYAGTWKKEGDFSGGNSSSYAVHNATGLKFPASGFRTNKGNLSSLGLGARYWSASADTSTSTNGHCLNFDGSSVNSGSAVSRSVGLAVRCVRD